MCNLVRIFAGLMLVVGLSSSLLTAQTTSAMVCASGKVTVNGMNVGESTSIFTGDQLATADSSLASLNQSGSSMTVRPNSSIQYNKAGIRVLQGAARVSTVNGMAAQAGQVTVSPASKAARFDVVRADNELLVTSREGALTVSDGTHTTTLQPGANATFALGFQEQAVKFIGTQEAGPLANGPFYSIDGPETSLPWCTNTQLCHVRSHVSSVSPCRCRHYY
jgi:ferric-dicitrate binding protein FerR (iron transport regulator)